MMRFYGERVGPSASGEQALRVVLIRLRSQIATAPEGPLHGHQIDLVENRRDLLRQVRLDACAKTGLSNPMRAVNRRWQQPTLQLVMTLRTRFKMRQAACDRALDELVIAALKMHKKGLMQGLFPNTNNNSK